MDLESVVRRATSTKSIMAGVVLVVLGLAALMAPLATSVVAITVLAWVLMLVGLTHVFSSWYAASMLDTARSIIVGVLYFAIGLAIQRHPLWSISFLTLIIGVVFVAEAVVGLLVYVSDQERATSDLVASLVTLLLGWMILNQWPSSSLFTIGLLIGVNLLAVGSRRLIQLVRA